MALHRRPNDRLFATPALCLNSRHRARRTMAMTDVFISYHSADRDKVTIIGDDLVKLKLDVWFDRKLRSGSAYDSQIAQQLESAKAVLTCWTLGAVKSDWVRSEADFARNSGKLVPCVLEPVTLPPPFNLVQAGNLSSWAGQEDDPAWLKILEQIGQLTDQPGLATYRAVMRPTATLPELKAWVAANAANPLSADVWNRISALEGENAEQKAAREAAEGRARAQMRKLQAKRSRELAKARGLRDPARERRQQILLLAAVLVTALVIAGWIGYSVDRDARLTKLDRLDAPDEVAGFIARNWYHPVRTTAEEKLRRIDDRRWSDAKQGGRKADFETYVSAFSGLSGQHLVEAQAALQVADRVAAVQQNLRRLGLYRGPADGALDEATRNTIARFRLRSGLPVSYSVDDQLIDELDKAIERWIRPTPSELRTSQPGPPSEDDMIALAANLGVELPALLAVYDLENVGSGFDTEGRPIIVFTPHIFLEYAKKSYDPTASSVSGRPRSSGLDHGSTDPAKPPSRWDQLEAAFLVDPEAAYDATSFGAFQILGLHAKRMGFASAGEFARFVSQSELNQYAALFLFGSNSPVLAALKARDWERYARAILGTPHYAKRLSEAYEREVAILRARPPWEAASVSSHGLGP